MILSSAKPPTYIPGTRYPRGKSHGMYSCKPWLGKWLQSGQMFLQRLARPLLGSWTHFRSCFICNDESIYNTWRVSPGRAPSASPWGRPLAPCLPTCLQQPPPICWISTVKPHKSTPDDSQFCMSSCPFMLQNPTDWHIIYCTTLKFMQTQLSCV